jgi:hypothetical protein
MWEVQPSPVANHLAHKKVVKIRADGWLLGEVAELIKSIRLSAAFSSAWVVSSSVWLRFGAY